MFDRDYILEKYLIKEVMPNEEWNIFNNESKNKNIFCDLDFINLDSKQKKFYSILKNKECVAKFFLITDDKRKISPSEELIFTPIIYRKISNQTQSSSITEKNEILGSFAYYILNNFKEAKLTLDYTSNDVRPFDWINFIEGKQLFSTDCIKYTQVINLKKIKNDELLKTSFYKNFSSRIKQSIKYSEEKSYEVIQEYDENFFIDTLENTFSRQNLKPDFDILKRAKILNKLFQKRKILMFITYDKNKKKICFSLFGFIKNNATYLHGGRVEDVKGDNSLAHNLFNSMISLNKHFGIETIDLEGVNSPQRAFFKAGFGGELKSYYTIKFKK